ncbi:MAG: polysulfide reductase NrfD [Coriobacteriales bacterium]|jgi:molybdopterin-containing oxidoreductase family membrane subunit|nr:polysulfide reductase NrfD [Coriobacteriales bacterium]
MTDKNNVEKNTGESQAKPYRSKKQLIAIIVCAFVAACGIGLWMFQLAGGMVNTNMRNLDAWGLYIIMFMLFVGLSAGGLIVSSVPKLFGIKGFGGISKLAIWTSICCTILAVAFVVVDLGGPLRVWHLFAYANLTSPLMWDIIVLSLYLIISIIYLWATLRSERGQGTAVALRAISAIALIAAVAVHTVTAWIFGLQIAHEFWYTALLGPWFVSSALLSGLALVLIVAIALRKAGYIKLESANLIKMTRLLGVFCAVDLYFFACDLLTSGFPGGSGGEVVAMLTTGPLAMFFWAEIIFGICTIIVAFTPALRKPGFITCAAIFSVLAIFAKRVQILVGGFQEANISYPTVSSGPELSAAGKTLADVGGALIYTPSPLEIGLVVGVLGLGTFLLLLGLRMLPLKPVEEQ